jgi:cellulose synthase/poly-beta-1,6-N-acetylglucosamine synthase-like glycosyltransferase
VSGLVSLGLIASVAMLVPATLLVFTVGSSRRTTIMRRRADVRLVLTALGIGLATLAIGALVGAGPMRSAVVAVVLGASVLAWLPAGRHWAQRGTLAWALTVDAGLLYLAWVAQWTLSSELSTASLVASALLWLLELFVFLIGLGYVWEFVDVLTRREWTAYVDPARRPAGHDVPRPFVSLHVPTHNEPPDLVIATLERLLEQDYDAYEIVLIDNNTTDETLWRPVEAWCAQHDPITFLHVEGWPGFKSGALNYALTRTDPRAEVIGIVDADYLVEPQFLSHCAPLFADDDISFVQTPQDYRSWEVSPYFRRLYYSYGYFFDVSQKSRNERNGAIFGGTMGLIRRNALEAAGCWDEWCITEDAELSLRLLKAGGRGVHIDRSYGYGVMPLTFEVLKRQRFRWCFGGIQILRMHWRDLLPGRRTSDNQLTWAQRWAYLVGGLQWFGDLASMWFTGFLVLGAVSAVAGDGLVVRRLSGALLFAVVVLLGLGAVRSLALVRRTSGARWGEALGAFGIWLALGMTVARASSRGLVARQGVFLRTPKVRGELGTIDAIKGNLLEIGLALLCIVLGIAAITQGISAAEGVGATLVGVLLMLQAAGYLAAPANSVAAIRSDLPEPLRRRRGLLLQSWGGPVRRGGLAVAWLGVLLIGFVVLAAPVGSPDLTRLPDDAASPGQPNHSPTQPGSTGPTSGATTSGTTVLPGSTVPAGATSPGQATQTTQASLPTQATQPTRATQPTQVTQPTQASQPTQPTQATQPTQQATSPGGQATSHPVAPTSTTRPTSAPTGRP